MMGFSETAAGWTLRSRVKRCVAVAFCALVVTGCHWDMWNQDRYEPLEAGDFFGEGQSSSRIPPENTVPYQMAKLDTHYYAGMVGDTFAKTLPEEIDLNRALLERGQERFNIYCTPCHGYTGTGNGMITKRGFPLPPSYHIDRLREAELGYFFDVMTNGFGRMYSYATRIPVEDRWAIAAYIRALQLSQAGTTETLPREQFNEIKELALNPPEPAEDDHGGGHGADDSHGAASQDDAAGHGDTNEDTEHGEDHGSEH